MVPQSVFVEILLFCDFYSLVSVVMDAVSGTIFYIQTTCII
jgi:hypothetical protein